MLEVSYTGYVCNYDTGSQGRHLELTTELETPKDGQLDQLSLGHEYLHLNTALSSVVTSVFWP